MCDTDYKETISRVKAFYCDKKNDSEYRMARFAEELCKEVGNETYHGMTLSTQEQCIQRAWERSGEENSQDICEWCDQPVENGFGHGEDQCFDALTGDPIRRSAE